MNNLIVELQKTLEGEVRYDLFSKQIYSVDASLYEIEPLVIVLPKTKSDITATIKTARKYQTPIIARGAGTGTTGGCIGSGIILDLSKFMNQIISVDYQNESVICQPGVIQDQLNQRLAQAGYRLGPDTSTGNRATLGGMLANNASGAHSMRYQRMVDHIEEVEIILSSGEPLRLGSVTYEYLLQKSLERSEEGRIYFTIKKIIDEYKNDIIARFPNIPRHVSGYNLDELIKADPINLAKLIAGSEGTLGVITELTLKICPAPKAIGLALLHFYTLQEALTTVSPILNHTPFAVEVIDHKLIQLGQLSPSIKKNLTWLKGEPGALLMVEFEGETSSTVEEKLMKFSSWTKQVPAIYDTILMRDTKEMSSVWALRKAAVGLIMSRRTYSRAVAFVEDLAVAPQKLPAFIYQFEALLHSEGFEAGFYGHAGPGCLHVRPFVNLRRSEELDHMKDLMEKLTDLVISYGGALSGEHGDGLVRSWLNPRLFGPRIYQAFKELKQAFDPENLMNPGKITEAQGLLENLKESPSTQSPLIPTFLDFEREGGFNFAVEMCNGNGQCRKREGLMCPTFQAYGDEYHSTRARAQSLRAIVDSKVPLEAFTSQELFDVLNLCISCKGCKRECPSLIDMAKMKAEFLHHYYQAHGIPWRSRLFAHIGQVHAWGSKMAPLSNWIAQSKFSKFFLNQLGVTSQRALPSFTRKPFSHWLKKQPLPLKGRPIVLFIDTFTEFSHPHIGISAFHLLTRLGYRILPQPWTCCGRSLLSKGFLPEAKKALSKVIERLYPLAIQGIPILGLEPSCLYMLKDDAQDFHLGEKAATVATKCIPIDEFLFKQLTPKMFSEYFQPSSHPIACHTHCHQKAIAEQPFSLQLLTLATSQGSEIQSTCCGMAGSFGYEKEHYEFSMQIGETHLFPAVRNLTEETCVVANGTSCREQILHGTGKTPLHIVELLHQLLKKN